MIKYLIFILFTIFFINGCSFSNNLDEMLKHIKNLKFLTKPSKNILLNFETVSDKIISDLLNNQDIFTSNNKISLYINVLKNKSNFLLDTKQLTNLIKNKISQHTKNIHLIEKNIIDENKKKLGLSVDIEDSIDTSTMMLLSRNNKIQYYLDSCIDRKNTFFSITIKLILVQTGEIVFSKTENLYL